MTFELSDVRRENIYLNNMVGLDEVYTFYHDETNNVGKSTVSKGRDDFNRFNKFFILGGVVFKQENRLSEVEYQSFQQRMRSTNPQTHIKEFKSKHFLNGAKNFETLLSKSSFGILMDFLIQNKISVHYYYADNLYYGLVDIVDSFIGNTRDVAIALMMMNRLARDSVKSALRMFFFKLKDEGLDFLQRHDYPNVPDSRAFYTELYDLIASKPDLIQQDQGLTILLRAIEQDDRYDGVLLQNNTPDLLADFNELYNFMYIDHPTLFLNSFSNFDKQVEVQRWLKKVGGLSLDGEKLTNYEFIESNGDSADNILIQISDFIVNIISMIFDHLMEQTSLDWVEPFTASLNDVQQQNFNKLRFLLASSLRENFVFRHGSSTQWVSMLLDELDLSVDEYNQFIDSQNLTTVYNYIDGTENIGQIQSM